MVLLAIVPVPTTCCVYTRIVQLLIRSLCLLTALRGPRPAKVESLIAFHQTLEGLGGGFAFVRATGAPCSRMQARSNVLCCRLSSALLKLLAVPPRPSFAGSKLVAVGTAHALSSPLKRSLSLRPFRTE